MSRLWRSGIQFLATQVHGLGWSLGARVERPLAKHCEDILEIRVDVHTFRWVVEVFHVDFGDSRHLGRSQEEDAFDRSTVVILLLRVEDRILDDQNGNIGEMIVCLLGRIAVLEIERYKA